MRFVLVFLLLASPVFGAEAVITGPSGGKPGDILVLDASESEADYFAWTVQPQLPEPRQTIMVLEGGAKCLVCSVPGTYTVTLAVSDANGIDQIQWTVTVDANGPSPGPGPEPPPEPIVPVIPEGRFKIAKPSYDAAMAVASPNRAKEAQALALGLEGVAASISAGVLSGAQNILTAILAANNAALGDAVPLWVTWGAAIGEKIKANYQAGLLSSVDDWSTIIREISTGLKAVK